MRKGSIGKRMISGKIEILKRWRIAGDFFAAQRSVFGFSAILSTVSDDGNINTQEREGIW